MDVDLILLVIFLAIDFVISIWNGYASGVALALLQGVPEKKFSRVAAYAGLGLGFTGMSYVMTIVLAFAAAYFGYLGAADLTYLISFDFLVFGACIIGFGIVVTLQSLAIAYRRRSLGSIALSAWNVFAMVLDVTVYISGFQSAYATLGGGARNRVNVYAIILMAILLAVFIMYAAYQHGYKSAQKATTPSYAYTYRPRPSMV